MAGKLQRLVVAIVAVACLAAPSAAAAAPWEAVGGGIDWDVNSIAVDPSGGLYVGGGFHFGCIAPVHTAAPWCTQSPESDAAIRWTGSEWSPLESGLGSAVTSLVLDGSGGIVAGGAATSTSGGLTINHVGRWNGSAWNALGVGVNGTVYVVVRDSAGDVYVGGDFTSAGGIPANGVAKWDGSTWSALGAGVDGVVYALAVDGDGAVYVSGEFSHAGGVEATRIARWDAATAQWTALGPGLNVYAQALAVDGAGALYAGGGFTRTGGAGAVEISRIAKWNGTSWTSLGGGVEDVVETPIIRDEIKALAIDARGNVYAGGDFGRIGGVAASRLAKWDGSTWTALATTVPNEQDGNSSYVGALAVDPTGYLYVGGKFNGIDSVPALNVARRVIADPPAAPGAARTVLAGRSATVSWSAPASDGGAPITGYTVTAAPGGVSCTWASGPLRCTLTGLRRGVRTTISIRAANVAGAGTAATVSVVVPAAIASVAPARGSALGGTRVVIRGAGLAKVTRMTIGGRAARIVHRSASRLVVRTPRHAAGLVAVAVTAAGKRTIAARAFYYVVVPMPCG